MISRRRAIGLASLAGILGALAIYLTRPRPIDADVFPAESVAVDGEKRTYRLVVPRSAAAGKMPLIVAFHGVGDSPEGFAAYSDLDRVAADEGFLLAYPAARRAMWPTVNVDPEALDEMSDVRLFDRIVEELAERYPVDRDRVFVVGMSNGGTFAQMLAYARSDVAGVVAHSGALPKELAAAPSRPYPLLLIVGEDDLVADAMRADADFYRLAGHDVELIVVPNRGHAWATDRNAEIADFIRDR